MKETNTKLNTILVKLTDITGFDHTPLALEAFAVARTDIKLLIQEAVAEERERMRGEIGEIPATLNVENNNSQQIYENWGRQAMKRDILSSLDKTLTDK